MKAKRKLFVVSDIHGHYTLMKQALDEAGFDKNNEEHIFICCGDLFDRGTENRKVYDYIRRLPRKILICGNHDERLAEIIASKEVALVDYRNGKAPTLAEFFGPNVVDDQGRLCLPKYGKMAGILKRFIGAMLDYYETDHYVFTHGWLPLVEGSNVSYIREDWRSASPLDWRRARWLQWQYLYKTPAMLPGKTIVCGHRMCSYGWHFDPRREETDSRIFYGDGMIAIDACTVRSGRVNVLVLEEQIELDDLSAT